MSLMSRLFGTCDHVWSKWADRWPGSYFQRRECSMCGLKQERYIKV